MAGATGLEPAASAVTGQRSNQLSSAPAGVGQDLKAALPQVKDNRVTRPTLREVPYFPQESLVKPVPNRLFGQAVWRPARLADLKRRVPSWLQLLVSQRPRRL